VAPTHISHEVEAIIKACFLQDLKEKKAGELSLGQKRRLTLGIALIGRPKLVVLDNPLGGVDPYYKR
jgi:ABC-type multidrug transport system ATPase subunit